MLRRRIPLRRVLAVSLAAAALDTLLVVAVPLGSAHVPSPGAATAATVSTTTAGKLSRSKVSKAIKHLINSNLGSGAHIAVAGVTGGAVFSHGDASATPASTMKLLTSAAALHILGPDHTFTTSVLDRGKASDGSHVIVLQGGGDPLLTVRQSAASSKHPALAGIARLAHVASTHLKAEGVNKVHLRFDASLFSSPGRPSSWRSSYSTFQAPVQALWVDEGMEKGKPEANPALHATFLFAKELKSFGIKVIGNPTRGAAKKTSPVLGAVQSAPLSEQIKWMLRWSDNAVAEVIAHQLGARRGQGTFYGGALGVKSGLAQLGVPVHGLHLTDASGLAHGDYVTPTSLISVLQKAANTKTGLSAIPAGLPVAGRTGTLKNRFTPRTNVARGIVHAKTGSLDGVDALAGYTTDRNGTTVVFVLIADHAYSDNAARQQLDKIATALTTCACG